MEPEEIKDEEILDAGAPNVEGLTDTDADDDDEGDLDDE